MYTQARLWILLAGVAVLLGQSESLRGSALVAELKAKAKAALLNPTEIVEEVVTVETDEAGNATSPTNVTITKPKSLLTGNPQKDYIYDPNLPRELNGYNLSSYPFYNGVPADIDFKCDDLHDGFYASVPHKCQVYHHCLFGTRYDFLCANYTAFDQRTFICHFVSEVDCDNSPKFFQRNEALYKAASTSPPIVITTTTTTTTPAPTTPAQRPWRRRPYRRRRPVYEYYYDDQYEDEEYYDDEPPPPRRKNNRKHRPQGSHNDEEGDYYEGGRRESSRSDSSRSSSSSRSDNSRGDGGGESSKETKPTVRVSGPAAGTVYDRPRVPPKIRRPVPIHERDKYDYTAKSTDVTPSPTDNPKKGSKPQNKHEEEDEEYYDYEYEEDYVKPPPKRGKGGSDSNEKSSSRRPSGRHRPRQNTRRRPERYDDDYEDDRPVRPRKRQRYEEPSQMGRGNRGGNRGYSREEPDPVPAERPGFISTSRLSSGGRKRNEEDKPQPSNKKTYTAPVYDEEEEEEYYDDEEGDVGDDEENRRVQKPSTESIKSRHADDYDSNNGRKSGRKPLDNTTTSKPPTKNHANSQPRMKQQEDVKQLESNKSSKRPKPDSASFSRDNDESGCRRHSCEEDYSDDSTENSSEKKLKQVSANDRNNERDVQISGNERERLFSSRFRDSVNDSKSKQQTSDTTGPGRTPAYHNLRSTTQNPQSQQRFKPSFRGNQNSDDYFSQEETTPTNVALPSSDSSDETKANKHPNFRSKGRIIPPTPLLDNYKPVQITEQPPESTNNNQEPDHESTLDSSFDLNSDKSVSPRPFSGGQRRPVKPVTETMPLDEESASQKTPYTGFNYRQAHPIVDENERPFRKQGNPAQNYRRVKVEPSQFEAEDGNQSKQSTVGNNFRRPNKPVEEVKPEDISYDQVGKQDAEENVGEEDNPPLTDKAQLGLGNGGAYRRVKVSSNQSPVSGGEGSMTANESPQSYQGAQPLPVVNYKRPFMVTRPLSNYPVVVEDTTKNSLIGNGANRRPVKQKSPAIESQSQLDDYNAPSAIGVGESYQKVEPNSGINVRPALGYYVPKRAKVKIEENSQKDLDQYPKQLNQAEQFSKQSPRVEITAPGPSAPDTDIATVKSIYKNNYNGGPPGFTLDIPEEEYDVTLNDALQPSTLHPTRSLVDYQQTRLKQRDYQTNIGRTPEYRGRVSYLLPAASQQYVSRVQSVYATEKQEENPITARYTSEKDNKKTVPLDQEEYEAVVLTAPSDQWPNQRRNRPTEWYW
ncbi:uncharacterized protein DDB_G0283697-like [Macrosteles quadrilineatus]|uniref:uncharacterized protein DDB_G0283697-like n=1 Tax=Macrosteles quadrilineatus TaxID=74068 RepID=UPI0023E24A40|nr:uncharacterized protein DDB_G0283697-like [Macrosteles quadrilineatus]